MRNLQFTGQLYGRTVTLQQISKPAARKLYDSGKEILLCPCKFVPLSSWFTGYVVKQDFEYPTKFESHVNSFTYYNSNYEMGYYPTFYRIINHQKHQQMKRAELTAIIKTAGIKKSNGSVNAQLMQMYIRATGQTDFRTFLDWQKAGYKVRKGEKAFGLWSRPAANLQLEKNPNSTPNDEDYSRHVVCNVFHRGQVEERSSR